MKKKIYNLLNNVETDLSKYEGCEMSQQEKDKILNNDLLKHKLLRENNQMNKNNNNFAKKAVVAAACFAVVASTIGANVYATTNPIAHSIAELLNLNSDLESYSTIIDQAVTKGDVSAAINDVVYDKENGKLIVASTLTSNTDPIIENTTWSPHLKLYINGKYMNSAQLAKSEELDEYSVGFVNQFVLDEEFDGDMDINLTFAGVDVNDTYVKERWEFEFTTNGDELSLDSFTEELAYDIDLGQGDSIQLNNFVSNLISTTIYYTTEDLLLNKSIQLIGEDNLGNPVQFINYFSRSGSDGQLSLDTTEYTLNDNVTSFTLQTYYKVTNSDGTISEFMPAGESFTVNIK